MKAVVVMLVLSTVTLSVVSQNCPERNETFANNNEGRSCRKACTEHEECWGELKVCSCDGNCGKSCFNPNANCTEPATISNGNYTFTSLEVGSTVNYTCNNGFILRGRSERRCNSDKKWSFHDQLPRCEATCKLNMMKRLTTISKQSIWESGDVAKFTCKRVLQEIRGNANVTCLSHGKWSGTFPECIYRTPDNKHTADGIEYFAYPGINVTKVEGIKNCTKMGRNGSLLIAYNSSYHRDNVIKLLEDIDQPKMEYWLAMQYIRPKLNKTNRRWKWSDKHWNTKNESTWATPKWLKRIGLNKNRKKLCPVIGRESCIKPNKEYCWRLRKCNRDSNPASKPLACQRVFNPCNYSPCRNMGTCKVDSENNLGYNCTCRRLYSGENCTDENFCALKENLSPSIAIDNLHAVQVERGVLVWRTGDTVTFRCVDQNERIQNNAVLQCIGNGVWNGSFPSTCEKYKCASPHEILNGHFSSSNIEHTIGAVITFSCNDGYLLEGDSTSNCLETGEWSHASTTCQRVCEAPQLPPSIQVIHPSKVGTYYINTETTLACQVPELNEVGPKTIHCQNNGTWSDVQMQCRGCSRPTNPAHGLFLNSKNWFRVGTHLEVTCRIGFWHADDVPTEFECLQDGTWSYSDSFDYVCTEVNIPNHGSIEL